MPCNSTAFFAFWVRSALSVPYEPAASNTATAFFVADVVADGSAGCSLVSKCSLI